MLDTRVLLHCVLLAHGRLWPVMVLYCFRWYIRALDWLVCANHGGVSRVNVGYICVSLLSAMWQFYLQ